MTEHLLIVEDEPRLRQTLCEILEGAGYATLAAEDARQGLDLLAQHQADLLLCDWKMPGGGGEAFLQALSARNLLPQLPVLVMTAYGTGHVAMQAMQLGAYDFLTKPLDHNELLTTVQRALQHAQLQKEVERLRLGSDKAANGAFGAPTGRFVGMSRPMLEVYKAIGRVAATDATVLILGESGVGKELVARAVHEQSQRSEKPFVVVNCAAMPADLLEAELFGHEKGAFTGAMARKAGRFESAQGGTIFLDEIGELPLPLQPKLLRILQEHTFERLGSSETLQADFRLVAATNRSLEEEVAAKRFRADLFYRLQVFAVNVPPLRERRTDIIPLAEHFLARASARNGVAHSGFADEALLLLQQYSYPGNVRELEHVVERAAVVAGGRVITRDTLAAALPQMPSSLREGLPNAQPKVPFHEAVAAFERQMIERALVASNGNKAEAARHLHIQRRLLYEKMRALGLETAGHGDA